VHNFKLGAAVGSRDGMDVWDTELCWYSRLKSFLRYLCQNPI